MHLVCTLLPKKRGLAQKGAVSLLFCLFLRFFGPRKAPFLRFRFSTRKAQNSNHSALGCTILNAAVLRFQSRSVFRDARENMLFYRQFPCFLLKKQATHLRCPNCKIGKRNDFKSQQNGERFEFAVRSVKIATESPLNLLKTLIPLLTRCGATAACAAGTLASVATLCNYEQCQVVKQTLCRPATTQNLVVKFDGEICGGVLVENASDDFPQQKKLKNLLPNFAGSSPPISPKASPTSLWKALVFNYRNSDQQYAWRLPTEHLPRRTESRAKSTRSVSSRSVTRRSLKNKGGGGSGDCNNKWGHPEVLVGVLITSPFAINSHNKAKINKKKTEQKQNRSIRSRAGTRATASSAITTAKPARQASASRPCWSSVATNRSMRRAPWGWASKNHGPRNFVT